MLKHAHESEENDRPDFNRLIDTLLKESRGWAEAEVALARIELAELKAGIIKAALLAGLGFAAGLGAIFALSQAAIVLLAPHAGGAGMAAAAVAVFFALAAVAAVLALRSALSWRRESIFFRWLGARPAQSRP